MLNPNAPNAGRSLSSQALVRGKTVLVAEAGRSGVVAPSDITALVDGSLNVLGELGDARPTGAPRFTSGMARWRRAADRGRQYELLLRLGRPRRPSEEGTGARLHDRSLGKKTGDVVSPIDGLVTFIRGVPSVWPRATLATVLAVLPSPRPWKAPTP